MTIKYALIVALVLATLACGQAPAASPTQDIPTPIPPPLPTSHPVAHSPSPVALTDLKVVELGSDYWPTDLSGERSVGIGRDGEVYLANVRTGEIRQLTNDGHRKRRPVISGDTVAWTDQSREIETHDNNSRAARSLADDIFVLDLNTGETRRITEAPAKRHGLQISGNRLVWQDNRNEIGEHYAHYDIYAYDLEANEEIAVAMAPGAQHWVAIEGDRVVWADNRNSAILGTDRSGCFECPDNRFDIYLFDFTTGDELVLDESGANNTMPDIHGNRVVWRDFDDDGRTAIRLYDIDTGEKRTLASPSLSGVDRPLVSGDYVVWTVGLACDVFDTPSTDGSTGAFAHDLRTGEVKQLSNYVEPSITLDGTVVVIHEACQVGGRAYAVFLGTDADTGESAPPSPSSADATDVEVVYASPARPLPWDRGQYDPLWGDLDADAPIIDRLLRAIAGGTTAEIVETDEERIWTWFSSLVMNIRFRNGTTWSVRTAIKCDSTSEGRKTNCLPVPDHWELLHRNEVVVSTALTEWFQRVREYMPSVEHYALPDQIRLGEPFAISGAGYDEGDRVELSIEFIDQSKLPLGEVPLDHGAFRWDGELPKTAPTGYAIVSMRVFEGAERVGGLTVSTTVVRSTAAGATTPSPTQAEAEYSAADLARWYERLVDVRKVPGIAWTDLNEAKNRIVMGVYPLRGAREEWEAALATLDVPRGAIVLEVGCEGIHPWPLDLWETPDEAFLRAIDYSLEVEDQASYGETVEMKLTLRNVSHGPVNLVLGGVPPFDFVVSTPDGEQVWHWKCAKITLLPLDSKNLEPGEELEFTGEWEQVDNRGEPVPPGTYLVRGILNMDPPEKLVTEAHELEILR